MLDEVVNLRRMLSNMNKGNNCVTGSRTIPDTARNTRWENDQILITFRRPCRRGDRGSCERGKSVFQMVKYEGLLTFLSNVDENEDFPSLVKSIVKKIPT